MNSNDYRMIVDGLSAAIADELKSKCSEESEPAHTPDASDDLISTKAKRVRNLRRIRSEVEEIAAGYAEPTIPLVYRAATQVGELQRAAHMVTDKDLYAGIGSTGGTK